MTYNLGYNPNVVLIYYVLYYCSTSDIEKTQLITEKMGTSHYVTRVELCRLCNENTMIVAFPPLETDPRIVLGILAHCPPSGKWVPGGNTGEVKGGEERNWPPYIIMPTAQDKCPSKGHSPKVRNRTWDSPLLFILQVL